MKRIYTASVLILVVAIAFSGCKNAATSTNSEAKPPQPAPTSSTPANSQPGGNANRASDGQSATESRGIESRLVGTFAMSEVHAGGVVNMISQLKTQISFLVDGTYSRTSMRNDKVYHTDAGQYRVEGNDHIVLLIKLSKQKVYDPPLERKHAFTISENGEELRLSSEDGKIAVFRKIKKA